MSWFKDLYDRYPMTLGFVLGVLFASWWRAV